MLMLVIWLPHYERASYVDASQMATSLGKSYLCCSSFVMLNVLHYNFFLAWCLGWDLKFNCISSGLTFYSYFMCPDFSCDSIHKKPESNIIFALNSHYLCNYVCLQLDCMLVTVESLLQIVP